MATPAHAAGPEQLCAGTEGALAAQSYPSDADLLARAQALDATSGEGIATGALDAALEVPDSTTQRPSAGALTRYCTAAGEAARTSSGGSQFQAHRYLLAAFRHAEASGEAEEAARASFRLGLVHAGDVGAAGGGEVRLRSSNFGEEVPDGEQPVANACGTVGSDEAIEMRGRFMSSLALECAATKATVAGDYTLASLSNLRLARLAVTASQRYPDMASNMDEVARLSLASVPTARNIADPVRRGEVIGRLAETALDAGTQDHWAVQGAIEAMRESAGNDAAVAAFAQALEGRLALATGNQEAAAGALQRAIFLESQRSLPERLPQWQLLLAQADPARRSEHVNAAFTSLETLRPFLPAEDPLTRESLFSLRMRQVFEAAVNDRLSGAQASDPARIAAAQAVVEAYRQAEIQDLFGDECAPPPTPFQLADLRPDEVVLYPILLDDRLELLYASGADVASGTPRFHRLAPAEGLDRTAATRLVNTLMELSSYDHTGAWREPARQLYDYLIAPVEGQLGAGTKLIIVPDSAFRAVPFTALLDGNGGYLVERASVAVAPALAYLQPGQEGTYDRPRVVAAALDKEVTLPVGSFPALPNTVQEAKIVTGTGQSGLRSGRVIENFTKADVERTLAREQIDVLHLATHASFNGGSDRSFIVARDELILLSELRDFISERRTRGNELELLVLSACETAVGDEQAAMGLAGAAVQAGAVSVLASLWQVEDVGTAALMSEFYTGLRSGKSKSDALRAAQLSMIERGGSSADPWVWAAFAMLGGWR
jgi:CHAT domain-containing protein